MGKNVFVSYKYADSDVLALTGNYNTRVRDYVDIIQEILMNDGDHIYKGENDGEDMSTLKDATIGSKLGDKIFYSSLTIILISKGMKNPFVVESEQWIPWEISYSLKEQSRSGGNSKTNAVLAVVLPDRAGSYNYFIEENTCPHCYSRTLHTNFLFQILRDNMFNIRKPVFTECANHTTDRKPYVGYSSFIHSVKWLDFTQDMNKYIDIAINIRSNINDYELTKIIK